MFSVKGIILILNEKEKSWIQQLVMKQRKGKKVLIADSS